MRLIDADALERDGWRMSRTVQIDKKTMELQIRKPTDFPAVEPQPEIIRCKDCKFSEHWYKDKRRCFLWHEAGIDVWSDGFCNYAERRIDDLQ